MKKYISQAVPVTFRGIVYVHTEVGSLTPDEMMVLANKMAISHIVATTDNPDAPDDEAFEDVVEELSGYQKPHEQDPELRAKMERAWDNAWCEVSGNWEIR